ncbi:MAG TPA: LysE family translocator [Ferrovibrio sp.]|uniref:LysE family translocator n=1 Tax=Ferrovibrio sp. TaxID=1917215 RepID=UPI002ED361BF
MPTGLIAYLSIAAIVIVTPGPDTAVTTRATLLGGRRAGIATGLGVACGLSTWAVFTSVGLVALLLASEPLFLAVKYAGAAYLIWLGLQALWGAWRMRKAAAAAIPAPKGPRLRPRRAFLQGLISDLGNPKIAIFFASILPQFSSAFTSLGCSLFAALLLLGVIFSLMTFVWLTAYATLIARAGDAYRGSRLRQMVEALTGAVLIALGLRIATESR